MTLRCLTFSALLAFGLIGTAVAQTPIQPTIAYLPNAATPTVVGLLAAPSGAAPNISATVATTSSTSVIGVTVVASDGLGLAHIVTSGPAACVFDAPPVAGHFVSISATVAGDCHDAGATLPGSGQIVGVYTGAQGSGNTYIVAVGTTGAIGAGSSSITIGSTPISGGTDKFALCQSGGKAADCNGAQIGGNGTGYATIGDAGIGSNFTELSLNGSQFSTSNFNLGSAPGASLFINRPFGQDIYFRENNSITQLLLKHSADQVNPGNVGIATTSPAYLFSVNGVSWAGDFLMGTGFTGATLAGPTMTYVGDSITAGVNGINPYPDYVTLPSYQGLTWTTTNTGLPSETLQTRLGVIGNAGNANQLINNNSGMNVVSIMEGTNDITSGSATVQQTFSFLQRLAQHERLLGNKVVVVTQISRIGQDANIQAYDALIRANWPSFADALADPGSDAHMGCAGCYSNSTYFQPDGTHPTAAGAQIIATYVQSAIDQIVTGPVNPTYSGALIAMGSPPTASGTCPINTQLGGNTAGSFKANGACSSGTVILTFAQTAPNGWVCVAHDLTTPADALNETAYTTTGCTITGSMANSDLVAFDARAF